MYVITYRCRWEIDAIASARGRVGGDGRCTSVRGSKNIAAKDEVVSWIKSLSRPDEWIPPVRDIAAASQGMADNQSIVAVFVERSPGLVCDRAVVQTLASFELEVRNQGIYRKLKRLAMTVMRIHY